MADPVVNAGADATVTVSTPFTRSATATDPDDTPVNLTNPFAAAARFYVDPENPAAAEARRLRLSDPARAEQFDKMGNSPVAIWAGDWIPLGTEAAWIDERVDRMVAVGALPVFVLYNIPVRDLSGYSGGGATSADAYRTWITNILTGFGSRRAALIYEPDALGQMNSLTAAQRAERVTLMTETIQRLAAAGHSVYTDSGHSAWHPVSTWIGLLGEVQAHNGRGIAVNVSNFRLTPEVEQFAADISAGYTAGTLYSVVDTSRNGNGPDPGADPFNPPGRALGDRPTATTATARCDAYFWIKRPGESDGADGSVGEDGTLAPAAGEFWPDYAFGLAKRSAWRPHLRVSKLTDTFDRLDLNRWPGSYGVTVEAGRARVPTTLSYPRFSTGTLGDPMRYSLIGSAVSVEVSTLPAAGAGSTSAILQVEAVRGANGQNVAEVLWQNGSIIFRELIDGAGYATDVSIPYDPVAHRWWQLRHDGFTLFWETSPDGIGWTVRRRAVPGIDAGRVALALVSGFYGTENTATVGYAEFDNLNRPPDATATVVTSAAVALGGGGFITGFSPPARDGTMWCTTDVFGGYRRDPGSDTWQQLLAEDRIDPAILQARDNTAVPGWGGMLSIAGSPSNPERCYAAFEDAVWRMDARNGPWKRVLTNTPTPATDLQGFRFVGKTLFVDPTNPNVCYYAGQNNQGLRYTRNGGESWLRVSPFVIPHTRAGAVVVDHTSPLIDAGTPTQRHSVVFASSWESGVYRSGDGGTTWRRIDNGGQPRAWGLTMDPTNGSLYLINAVTADDPASTDTNVWRWVNGLWSNITPPAPTGAGTARRYRGIAVSPHAPGRMVIVPNGSGHDTVSVAAYQTNDVRAATPTWSVLSRNAPNQPTNIGWHALPAGTFMTVGELAWDPLAPDTIWLSEGLGVWRAVVTPSATSVKWVETTKGIEALVNSQVLAPPGNDSVFAINRRRSVFRRPLTQLDVYPDASWPAGFAGAYAADYARPTAAVPAAAKFIAVLGGTAADPTDLRGSGYSLDGGLTFQNFPTMPAGSGGAFGVVSDQVLVFIPNGRSWSDGAGGGHPGYSAQRTTDRGVTWAPITFPGGLSNIDWGAQGFWSRAKHVEVDHVNPNTVYLYGPGKPFLRSTDGGATWVQQCPNSTIAAFGEAFNEPYNIKLRAAPGHQGHVWMTPGHVGGGSTSTRFIHSTDGGATWREVPGMQAVDAFAFGAKLSAAQTYPTLYAYGYQGGDPTRRGLYYSTNADTPSPTWEFVQKRPHGSLDLVGWVEAQPDEPGLWFVGLGGSGARYGNVVSRREPSAVVWAENKNYGPPPFTGTVVNVATAQQLTDALAAAIDGHDIVMAAGTYTGNFQITKAVANRARLRAADGATVILQSATTSSALFLKGAERWDIGSDRGTLILDGGATAHSTLAIGLRAGTKASTGTGGAPCHHINVHDVEVRNSGFSCVRIGYDSTHIVLSNSAIHDSGKSRPEYGEGVYVGSSNTTGTLDFTNNVQLLGLHIYNLTAEGLDFKDNSHTITVDGCRIHDLVFTQTGTTYVQGGIAQRSLGANIVIRNTRVWNVSATGNLTYNQPFGLYLIGPTTVENTLVWNNGETGARVDGWAGGAAVVVTFRHCVFWNNGGSPSSVRLANSPGGASLVACLYPAGSLSSAVTTPESAVAVAADFVGPLTGAAQTTYPGDGFLHASGSAHVDAVATAPTVSRDHRDVPRPQNIHSDRGPFEMEAAAAVPTVSAITNPPAGWELYTALDVSAGGEFFLNNDVDYKIVAQTVPGAFLRLRGGRNIVVMGMTRRIGTAGNWGRGETNVGIEFRDEPGGVNSGPNGPTDGRIIHVEGVKLESPVDSQGFLWNCSSAYVRVVNCRGYEPTAPSRFKNADQRDGSNGLGVNHPDLSQSHSGFGGRVYGFKSLTIDGFTAFVGYQGIFLKQEANADLGDVSLRRVDLTVAEFIGVEEDGKADVAYYGGATFWNNPEFPDTSSITFGESVYMKHHPRMLVQGGNYVGKSRQWLNRHSFDATVEGWGADNTEVLAHETTIKKDGGGSLRSTEPGGGANLLSRLYGPAATKNWSAGETALYAWIFLPAGSPGSNHRGRIVIQDTALVFYEGPDQALTVGGWTRIRLDVATLTTAPAGVRNLSSFNRIGVQVAADAVTGDLVFYVDEFGQYQTLANPAGGVFTDCFQPAGVVTTGTDGTGTFAEYPDANVSGRVYSGAPPTGEHVPAGLAGATYKTAAWYSNGTQPAKPLASLRTIGRAQYDDFFAHTEATDGMPAGMPAGARRVKVPDQVIGGWPQAGGTVSEGMGYGLKLCVWYGNPALPAGIYDPNARTRFDSFWTYIKFFLNARGLMSWSIRHDGTIADTGSAADGDFDIIYALWRADEQWGSAGTVNYAAEATAMTNACLAHNFTPTTYTGPGGANVMLNGDAWGVDTDVYMPDYFRPAYFRKFAQRTGNSRWIDIINKNYPIALGYFNTNFAGGVVPDRCKRDGTQAPSPHNEYRATYNSVRMGFGVVADLLWNGTGGVSQAMPSKAAAKAKGLWHNGGAVKAPPYDLNLTAGEPYGNNSGFGLFGPCALVDSANATFAAEIVDAISADTELSYYNMGVATVAMAFMAGVAL